MEQMKLVTVTRTDLPEGYQAVQSTHAAIDFIFEHPSRAGPWKQESNTLVMLTVKDTKALIHLIRKCDYLSLAYTVFREPDIGNQITAICMEPHPEVYKMVAKLPLLIPKIESNDTRISNKSTSLQPYQENTVQEETNRHDNTGERSNIQSDIFFKPAYALGTKRLQDEEKG